MPARFTGGHIQITEYMKNTKYIIENAFPASKWQDGTPLGNGRIGVLVYGSVYDERILLNHEELYDGATEADIPDISGELPALRKLLDEGKYLTAERFYTRKLRSLGYKSKNGNYLPAFDIHIVSDVKNAFTDYSRSLDMSSGVATVRWKDGDSERVRETFVDYESGTVFIRVLARGEKLGFDIKLERHDLVDAVDKNGDRLPKKELPKISSSIGKNRLISRLTLKNGKNLTAVSTVFGDGDVEYVKRGKTVKRYGMQGSETFKDNFISVRNASEAIIVCKLFFDENAEEFIISDKFDYEEVKKRHVEKFSETFLSCELSLTDEDDTEPTEIQRIRSYNGNVTLSQIEKQALFGRYLLISSSSDCKYPANLQGIWNGAYQPAWNCVFFNNENLEMSYWQALGGNLAKTTLPLFDAVLSFMDDYRENAKKLYGCRGILLPLFWDNTSGKKKDLQPHVLYWTASSAWIADMFFDYFLHTRDEEFLKEKAYPFMKEAALFYEDFMQTDENGHLKSYPSDSPENCADGDFKGAGYVNVSVNATMDFSALKQLLTDLLEAEKYLGITDEKDELWRETLEKIPPYAINEDGAICEWLHKDFRDNYKHRHLSHLYPLFPGREITEKDEELFAACKRAIELRQNVGLKEQTGWSFSHLANLYASVNDGEKAEECLRLLIRFCVGVNLFTYHNDTLNQGVTLRYFWAKNAPFQIDANLGFTAAVQNMLIRSTEDEIKIFPATPSDWENISYGYALTRCGVKIKLIRKEKLITVKLTALCDAEFTLASGIKLKNFSRKQIIMKRGDKTELKLEKI